MSSQKTEHYELNQWLATDQVLRTDFNADNAKIDAALNTLAGQVSGKADGEAFQALSAQWPGTQPPLPNWATARFTPPATRERK